MRDRPASVKAAGSAWLFHANGMHARPAIKLTKLARRFSSSVAIGVSADGPWTDAKSIAKVMGMKTPSGVMLYFEAEGSDAHEAVTALIALVTADFANADDAGSGAVPQPT
jgi:phosphocarrier protein HPr